MDDLVVVSLVALEMIDEVEVCLKEKGELVCSSLPKALWICHRYLSGYSGLLVSESYVVSSLGMQAQMVQDSLTMVDPFFLSVKKMVFQDNVLGAGLLVDLDLNASKSLEVDLEAAGPSGEPPMVVALRLLRRQNDRSQEVDLVEVSVKH